MSPASTASSTGNSPIDTPSTNSSSPFRSQPVETIPEVPQVRVPTVGPTVCPAFPHRRVYRTASFKCPCLPHKTASFMGSGTSLAYSTDDSQGAAQGLAFSQKCVGRGEGREGKKVRQTPTKTLQQGREDKQEAGGGGRHS